MPAASQAVHLACVLAGMGASAREAGQGIARGVRRRVRRDEAHASQQFARGEPQFAAAQLLSPYAAIWARRISSCCASS